MVKFQKYTFKRGKIAVTIEAQNVLFALNQYLAQQGYDVESFVAREIIQSLRLCQVNADFKEWVFSKCGLSADPRQNVVFVRVALTD